MRSGSRLEAELHCYPRRVDRDEIVRVLRAFEQTGLEYVLIGATAMGFLDHQDAAALRERFNLTDDE
jgi:hypothetical protein